MVYLQDDDRIYSADDYAGLLIKYYNFCFDSSANSPEEMMVNSAARCREVYNFEIRTDTPEHYFQDLAQNKLVQLGTEDPRAAG